MRNKKSSGLLDYYKLMLLIRAFENKVAWLFTRGKVHGTAHFCVGQEAVAVGACSVLEKNDFVTSTHRGHGHAIARGLNIKKLMAELLGRKDGYCAGRGGTQHTTSKEHNFITNGVTGGMTPVATGIALSYKMNKQKNAVLSFFGDGALNEGHVHEAINLAAVWKLPVIFLCENNGYAMSTSLKEAFAIKKLSGRAKAYGIQGETIDGNDLEKVHSTVAKYVKLAREGKGPVLIECITYRFSGHSKNDQCLYRTKEEENNWKKKDPVLRLKRKLIKEKLAASQELEDIEKEVEKQVEEAAEFALNSPEVNPQSLRQHVYD